MAESGSILNQNAFAGYISITGGTPEVVNGRAGIFGDVTRNGPGDYTIDLSPELDASQAVFQPASNHNVANSNVQVEILSDAQIQVRTGIAAVLTDIRFSVSAFRGYGEGSGT